MKFLTVLIIPLLIAPSVHSQGAGDAAFSAFMSTLVMPSEQNPCIGLKNSKVWFKAEDLACDVSFLPKGRNCLMIYKNRKLKVNRKYCQASGFSTAAELYLSKKQYNNVKMMKKIKFKSK